MPRLGAATDLVLVVAIPAATVSRRAEPLAAACSRAGRRATLTRWHDQVIVPVAADRREGHTAGPSRECGAGERVRPSLKQLLGTPLVFLPSSRVTVGQVVTLAANVRGGFHPGRPRDPAHQAFETFRLKLRHGDMPKELLLVVEISKVVLAGLEPLRIVARQRSPGPTARVPRVARVSVETVLRTPENQATIRR
jgi:hypothetical protein